MSSAKCESWSRPFSNVLSVAKPRWWRYCKRYRHYFLSTYRWPNAILQYLQCVSNGYTVVLHQAIDIKFKIFSLTICCGSVQGLIKNDFDNGLESHKHPAIMKINDVTIRCSIYAAPVQREWLSTAVSIMSRNTINLSCAVSMILSHNVACFSINERNNFNHS